MDMKWYFVGVAVLAVLLFGSEAFKMREKTMRYETCVSTVGIGGCGAKSVEACEWILR